MKNATCIPVGFDSVVCLDTLASQNPEHRRTTITVLTPSCWEEGTGYAPAESVSVQVYPTDLRRLIEALTKELPA